MFLTNILSAWLLMSVAFSQYSTPARGEIPPKNPIKWAIEKTSTLKVAGRSNVNEFTCNIPGYYQPDTISYTEDDNGRAVRLNGCLKIDVFRFDCHNKLITNDLRKTLKAEDHPTLIIRFVSLERTPNFQNITQKLRGWVEVELAGVRKTFQINYEFARKSNETYVLNGSRAFYFSDFNLAPPRKLAGAIKIKDEFSVDFSLRLLPLN
jgi:hypothetical protein